MTSALDAEFHPLAAGKVIVLTRLHERPAIIQRGFVRGSACSLAHLQVLSLLLPLAGQSAGAPVTDAAEAAANDDQALASADADTDGLDAAAPYSDTLYEDEDADSLESALPALEQDMTAEHGDSDDSVEESSSDATQPQAEEDASDPVGSETSIGDVSEPQAEATDDTEGVSRTNGTIIKRTPSSITFKF